MRSVRKSEAELLTLPQLREAEKADKTPEIVATLAKIPMLASVSAYS